MKKWLKITLISISLVILVFGSLLVFSIIPLIGKNTMLHPDHEAMYVYPHDYDMTYENVTFTTSDGLGLKGWFIEPKNSSAPNSNITIIVLHGATHSKAFMLDHYGEGFYNLDYRLFFFDSRNRGESPDTLLGLTWGIDEVKDVKAAVNYTRHQPGVNASQIVLFAESQGAATILFYTAQYNDVAAIIADSSWAYGDLMIRQAYPMRSGFPWAIFGQITIAMMETHYGYSFADISPAKEVYNITIPTYIIHGNADLDINPEDATTIYNALNNTASKLLWRVDDRGHVEAYLEPNYFTNIQQFINNNI
ncbi:MAG: alpha/beta hydrolase [Candidatus Heimdallarchaeota archaeon]